MGNACCQEAHKDGFILEVSDIPKISQYVESDWPKNDHFLHKQLSESCTYWNYSAIYNSKINKRPMKHRNYDRWYWGGWSHGKPKGKGILYMQGYQKSTYYEGDFNGEPEGEGRAVFNEGQAVYQGQVSKSRANGMGRYINYKDGSEFSGKWKNSVPYKGQILIDKVINPHLNEKTRTKIKIDQQQEVSQIYYPDGRIYYGQIDKGRFFPHGLGKVDFPNKNCYLGNWYQGQMHGIGKFQWNDKSSYEGQYVYGKKHGEGKFVFPSGNFYKGEWENGKQHGRGTLYDQNGHEIKNGYWKNGQFDSN